ncbi:MAG: FtsK/SpoIIIE domain-containing protein [Anaeroplasmataceae bacterium]
MFSSDSKTRSDTLDMLLSFEKSDKMKPIMFDDFLSNLLEQKSEQSKSQYPKTIKIARSIKEMLDGDLTPLKVIEIPSPITYNGREMWQLTAEDILEIHIGYKNGDKRYLSELAIDSKNLPHCVLGGSTGSGKSVTLNAILFSIFYIYAPWEVNVHMSDSKITEFARYGSEHHIPHIKNIAATSDAGYIKSMVENFKKDMIDMNSILSSVGARNLADFREKTGLTVARNFLIMDEFQTMILDSGKKANEVVELINLVAKLGRSVGYNMLLASQEVASEVKPLLTNIPIRMCLKASESVSDMILGNNQGAVGDVGVGKVYSNTESARKKKEDNTKFLVPYQTDKMFAEQGKFLEELGVKLGLDNTVNFYDEKKKLKQSDIERMISNRDNTNSLVIGQPSFISETPDRLQLNFTDKDFENILVLAPTPTEVYRFFKTFYLNSLEDKRLGTTKHEFLVADDGILGEIDIVGDGQVMYKIKDLNSTIWKAYQESVYTKMMLLEADEHTFNNPIYDNEDAISLYKRMFGDRGLTEVNKSRITYYLSLINQDTYAKAFGIGKFVDAATKSAIIDKVIGQCFGMVFALGDRYLDSKITKDSLPRKVIHVVGHHKINGLGRAVRDVDSVKQMLMDSYEANMRFIFYTINVSEIMGINDGFKYYIMDNSRQQSSRVKCDDYPANLRPPCAVIFDRLFSTVQTFKKLSLPTDRY